MMADQSLIYSFESYEEFYERMAHEDAEVYFIFGGREYLIDCDWKKNKKNKQRELKWFIEDITSSDVLTIEYFDTLDEMLNAPIFGGKSINECFQQLEFTE